VALGREQRSRCHAAAWRGAPLPEPRTPVHGGHGPLEGSQRVALSTSVRLVRSKQRLSRRRPRARRATRGAPDVPVRLSKPASRSSATPWATEVDQEPRARRPERLRHRHARAHRGPRVSGLLRCYTEAQTDPSRPIRRSSPRSSIRLFLPWNPRSAELPRRRPSCHRMGSIPGASTTPDLTGQPLHRGPVRSGPRPPSPLPRPLPRGLTRHPLLLRSMASLRPEMVGARELRAE
jgi:hypothetical protein